MKNSQKKVFLNGNEAAALAAKQIRYHVMGYYPITPSTRIVERLDEMKAEGLHDISLIEAEGEHSAAGICYGAAACGARAFNATSANGLLYSLEQLPVQSGTRAPMVLNVATRTVSGPLSIKCDHSDIMYALNTGWIILFAVRAQDVYDMNICAIKIAERCRVPVMVAFDGFFTSHQSVLLHVFEEDCVVQDFVGKGSYKGRLLDLENPVAIGEYMNEPDLMNNRYQLYLAMEQSAVLIEETYKEYEKLSGRRISKTAAYRCEDAEELIIVLGSSFQTAKIAVDRLREENVAVGVATLYVLRPFPSKELLELVKSAKRILILDRQDSYGGNGGNLSLEIMALLARNKIVKDIVSRVYGLGGLDLYAEEICELVKKDMGQELEPFGYLGQYPGEAGYTPVQYFEPISEKEATPDIDSYSAMPKRVAPGHGACPGCGIFVNVNLLLSGITGNVVLLFHTGCGMIVTSCYPKNGFRVPYIHNLFQNGPAAMTGIVEAYHQLQRRGEYPQGHITFVMVSGDGGMDIGMGSAIAAALRDDGFILLEYDNGGYMNTGYQQSYSTPKGAKSKTSHVGTGQYGKAFFGKDMPQIMAATGISYVATMAESHPADFRNKAKLAAAYAAENHFVYLKCLSVCPLNWQHDPRNGTKIVEAAVNSCYFPLYQIEKGVTKITVNPEKSKKKIPVEKWLEMTGRTKHLVSGKYDHVLQELQQETDRRWQKLLEVSK